MLHAAPPALHADSLVTIANNRKVCPAPGSPSLRKKLSVRKLNFY